MKSLGFFASWTLSHTAALLILEFRRVRMLCVPAQIYSPQSNSLFGCEYSWQTVKTTQITTHEHIRAGHLVYLNIVFVCLQVSNCIFVYLYPYICLSIISPVYLLFTFVLESCAFVESTLCKPSTLFKSYEKQTTKHQNQLIRVPQSYRFMCLEQIEVLTTHT